MNTLSNRSKTCQFCGHALRRTTPSYSGHVCLMQKSKPVGAEDTCDQFDSQEWTTLTSKVKKRK